MTGERFPCTCRCACPATAAVAGDPCPSCRVGAHRPPGAIRDHLAAGLDAWIPLAAAATSPARLRQAVKAWRAWHDARPCPLEGAR